jgi:ATP/maltotriose-dependent transcriptional regulator MalT
MTARMVDTDRSLLPIEGIELMQVPDRRLRTAELWLSEDEVPSSPMTATVVDRPVLFDRLAAASRVTQITAPPGSGKTMLLRSWIGAAGLADRAGWVSVQRGDRDVQRFWVSVIEALGATAPGSKVRGLTPSPELDGWAIVERLLEDLSSLEGRVWLVIDDVHELRSAEALAQLELLLLRSPAHVRYVLATVTINAWVCTGCAWRVASPNSAPPTCASACPRPAPCWLLERHSRHRTSHASLIAEILNRLAGGTPAPSPADLEPLREPLSDSEQRILRYLPTHLSAPEIAGELYLSVHTVKSHMRHLYNKLGTHQRADTVERARTLGLLAPSSRQR